MTLIVKHHSHNPDYIDSRQRDILFWKEFKGKSEKGEETPLKAGDFALVNPSEKHQYRNKGNRPFKMICGVPKEFE